MADHDPKLVKKQASGHITRRCILALFTQDESRSLAADDLLRDLKATHPKEYKDTVPGQVHYHRVRLQQAGQLPV